MKYTLTSYRLSNHIYRMESTIMLVFPTQAVCTKYGDSHESTYTDGSFKIDSILFSQFQVRLCISFRHCYLFFHCFVLTEYPHSTLVVEFMVSDGTPFPDTQAPLFCNFPGTHKFWPSQICTTPILLEEFSVFNPDVSPEFLVSPSQLCKEVFIGVFRAFGISDIKSRDDYHLSSHLPTYSAVFDLLRYQCLFIV